LGRKSSVLAIGLRVGAGLKLFVDLFDLTTFMQHLLGKVKYYPQPIIVSSSPQRVPWFK